MECTISTNLYKKSLTKKQEIKIKLVIVKLSAIHWQGIIVTTI